MTDLTLSELEELANSGYTEGPWGMTYKAAFELTGNVYVVMSSDRFPTAFVPAWNAPALGEVDGAKEARANAELQRAAPDLLSTAIASKKREAELEERLKEAREKALEEAAKVADDVREGFSLQAGQPRLSNTDHKYLTDQADGARTVVQAIRSLKEKSND